MFIYRGYWVKVKVKQVQNRVTVYAVRGWPAFDCRCLCYTLGRQAFSVAGPTVWNSLPDELRYKTENTFRKSLKTLQQQSVEVLYTHAI